MLELAIRVWEARHEMTVEDRLKALPAFQGGPFSLRQVAAITGLPVSTVRARMTKTDKTGGRLNPLTLRHLAVLEAGWTHLRHINPDTAKFVLENGTSLGMCARLTGISEHRLKEAGK